MSLLRSSIRPTNFRPFIRKFLYFNRNLNEMQYQLPEIFPKRDVVNPGICFCVNGKDAPSQLIGHLTYHFTGDTQCLPLYRYTSKGRRVSNITAWGLQRINNHYRKEWGKDFDKLIPDGAITAEQIFAYTYAVLHDPAYRHDYAIDLLREFPRLPLYHDFDTWARMGQQLLDLHIGFESAEPYALKRLNTAPKRARDVAPHHPERRQGARSHRPGRRDHPHRRPPGRLALPPRQPLRPRMGPRPVQGAQAQGPDHRRKVRHLPLRRPQGARHRPAAPSLHRQRRDHEHRRRHGVLGGRRPHRVRRPRQARNGALGLSQSADRPEDPEWEAAWSETS